MPSRCVWASTLCPNHIIDRGERIRISAPLQHMKCCGSSSWRPAWTRDCCLHCPLAQTNQDQSRPEAVQFVTNKYFRIKVVTNRDQTGPSLHTGFVISRSAVRIRAPAPDFHRKNSTLVVPWCSPLTSIQAGWKNFEWTARSRKDPSSIVFSMLRQASGKEKPMSGDGASTTS